MIASYILLNIIVTTQALIQLPTIDDNSIAITETAIRHTVNSLFAAFKIPKIKNRTRIKQMSTIHNFFVSIMLKDCENLKKITRLSTVNNIDNGTQHFIAQINEVLNESDKKKDESDNEDNFYVTVYIKKFIEKLKHLKEEYVFNRNSEINSDILKHINAKNNHFNISRDNIDSNGKDEKMSDEDIFDDSEFWQPSARRIYRGIRSKIKRFPFMASVHFFSQFTCAGSIIKNDLVITSASCLQIAWNNRFFRLNPTFLSVIVGCDYYERCGDNIAVLEIFFHPQYDPKTLKHNLAIMKLSRLINFKRTHKRVKKIEFDKNPAAMPANKGITIIGWGAKDASNIVYNKIKNRLSYKELDFIPLDDCQQRYSKFVLPRFDIPSTKEFVTHRNFCAGFYTKGGGACSHDAGGPAIIENILMGVVSFGSPRCGAPDVPTVFTKLGYYSDWIEDVVQQAVLMHRMGTSTPYVKGYSMADRITTTTLRIYPIGYTTFKPIGRSQSESLKIAEDQLFKDFWSATFRSDITDNAATTASETNKQKSEDLTSEFNAELKQAAVISTGTQGVTYDYDISDIELTTASATPVSEMFPNDNMNLNNQNLTLSMASETESESSSDDDKSLEEDIVAFIDNLDLDQVLPALPQEPLLDISQNSTTAPLKSRSQNEESIAQENKTNSNKPEDMPDKHQFLKSLFFPDVNSDTSDDDTLELSIGD